MKDQIPLYPGQERFTDLKIVGFGNSEIASMYAESLAYLQELGIPDNNEARKIIERTGEMIGLYYQTTGEVKRVKECFVRSAFEILSAGSLTIPEFPVFPNILAQGNECLNNEIVVPSLTAGRKYWLMTSTGRVDTVPVLEYMVQVPGSGTQSVKIWLTSPAYEIDDNKDKVSTYWSTNITTVYNGIDRSLRNRVVTPNPLTTEEVFRLSPLDTKE